MDAVPDMRRRSPEPPAGPPGIQFKPGMANELLHELAPLLAEEGIDAGNIDVADPDTLQQAVGRARDLAAVTLRLAAEAIADGDTRRRRGFTRPSQQCLATPVPASAARA